MAMSEELVMVTNSSFLDGLEIYAERRPDEYTESSEWIGPHLLVRVNDMYWWEDAHGRTIDPLETKHLYRNFKRPYVQVNFSRVEPPVVVTENALMAPFDRAALEGIVSAQLLQTTVDRANQAIQAMRAFERSVADKIAMSIEEQDKMRAFLTQVHETQGDFMYASRNRAFQTHGIWPGQKNKRIAHVHVGEPLRMGPVGFWDKLRDKLRGQK